MTRRNLQDLYRQQRIVRRRMARQHRRGVLLMVVLAMLALFLLLGTAFLMTSGHYWDAEKAKAKLDRVDNQPGDELERAMLQVLRDTNNPHSAVRGHSLLRDMYGADGFIGRVYANDALPTFVAQYAGAAFPGHPNPLGATEGQLIDIYVLDKQFEAADRTLEARHVVKLERGSNGLAIDHKLAGANGYYAGCVLTMLEGPAAGRSTRIIDYTYVGTLVDRITPLPLYRLRVMGFAQANGEPLNVGGSDRPSRPLELRELVAVDPNDNSRIEGYAFVVNGRPHNGTGVGLNSTAATGQAKLSAVELNPLDGTNFIGTQIALTPNAQFVDASLAASFNGNSAQSLLGFPAAQFQPLNDFRDGTFALYPTYEGFGGSDESYDAPDYQNMFLASMPLTPRARGGFTINLNGELAVPADQAQFDIRSAPFIRIDIDNVPIPSFHRPALVNYWYHRLTFNSFVTGEASSPVEAAAAVLLPYGQDGIRDNADDPSDLNLSVRDQIVALKRKFLMRPLREDHPAFNGSNPLSHYSGVTSPVDNRGNAQFAAPPGQIQFPFWEAIGPWDVDNDGDGIPDGVWVDLGEPVQETEDGRLYKRLYSFLILDMDNKLDLNAHGSDQHMVRLDLPINDLDPTRNNNANNINLVGGSTSNILPAGMGWGTSDVSLRPIFSPNLPATAPAFVGNAAFDDYARLLSGNPLADGFGRPRSEEWGKLGSQLLFASSTPGLQFNGTTPATIQATRERHTWFDFAGYPEQDQLRLTRLRQPFVYTQYGESPDLRCRYVGIGVGYGGQVVNEAVWDNIKPTYDALNYPVAVPGGILVPPAGVPLIDDSLYEIDISFDARKDIPQGAGGNDDAPFATAELERILRAHDADTGALPSRLWNLVDSFDPVKYAQVAHMVNTGQTAFNPNDSYTPEELAPAQTITAINRRQVTTDTSNAPVPSEQVPSYINELGEDGAPGIAGIDDNDNGAVDDLSEVGFRIPAADNPLFLEQPSSDDFATLTGKSVGQARLIDVAWYRIQKSRLERLARTGNQNWRPYNVDNPLAVVALNAICEQILPPEVIRGEKMDLNRPFGDGVDNNNNGVADEPIEAGEPFVDANGNNRWDAGEPFINLDASRDDRGTPSYTPPLNRFASDVPGEAALGDVVMGRDVSGAKVVNGSPLRDDQHLARQLYARHLYVMMLLLTDENYVAPYDYHDPQVRRYLRLQQEAFEAEVGNVQLAKSLAQRKLTMREIAQWAANAVDYRDGDAICTPFEYDENPWDGWNLTQNGGNVTLPIDSDPATNENGGQFINWANATTDNNDPLYGARIVDSTTIGPGAFANLSEQTRGLVWGAERPELLITENLNFHDRRTEDGRSTSTDGHKAIRDPESNDDDNDQRLRPRGSSFVELYNPWGNDSQRPIELYSRVDPRTGRFIPSLGVELGRLTNMPTADGYRSPVWRMIVVEEFPEHRNDGGNDNNPLTRDDPRSQLLARYPEHVDAGRRWDPPGTELADDNDPGNGRWNFRHTNPDWTEMYTQPINGREVPMEEWALSQIDTAPANYLDPTEDSLRQPESAHGL